MPGSANMACRHRAAAWRSSSGRHLSSWAWEVAMGGSTAAAAAAAELSAPSAFGLPRILFHLQAARGPR